MSFRTWRASNARTRFRSVHFTFLREINMRLLTSSSALALCIFIAACGDTPEPTPTEATCPTANAPTWDGFAKPFFDQYCVRCHSSSLTGDARNGAPEFHDFDTQQSADGVLVHIDEQAGSGPAATNTLMPPSDPRPSKAEREMLAQWVACECQTVACSDDDP